MGGIYGRIKTCASQRAKSHWHQVPGLLQTSVSPGEDKLRHWETEGRTGTQSPRGLASSTLTLC